MAPRPAVDMFSCQELVCLHHTSLSNGLLCSLLVQIHSKHRRKMFNSLCLHLRHLIVDNCRCTCNIDVLQKKAINKKINYFHTCCFHTVQVTSVLEHQRRSISHIYKIMSYIYSNNRYIYFDGTVYSSCISWLEVTFLYSVHSSSWLT